MSDTNEILTIYSAKYALSSGKIKTIKARRGVGDRAGYFYPVREEGYSSWTSFKEGRDAFLNYGDAVDAADKMRRKRIASLQQQIAKLERAVYA